MAIEIQVLDTYGRYDRAKDDTYLEKVMATTELFLRNGVIFSENGHPLDYMMRLVMREIYMTEDTALQNAAQVKAQEIGGLMLKYKPELLQKYYSK